MIIEWTALDEEAAREGRATGPRMTQRVRERLPFDHFEELLCDAKQKITDTTTTISANGCRPEPSPTN